MTVITFFSEKGGTGKTTLTALLACYLKYKLNKDVTVIDFDYPSYHFTNIRNIDNNLIANLSISPMSANLRRFYHGEPIFSVRKMAAIDKPTPEQIKEMIDFIRKAKDKPGYLLLDFPGRFLPSDPVFHLCRAGLIDLMVIPIDSDRQSINSVKNIISVVRNKRFRPDGKAQDVVLLWNKETTSERRGSGVMYSNAEIAFNSLGVPFIRQRIHDISIARRDASSFGFIRNTVCWPEVNIQKACPYIVPIFDEILLRAEGKEIMEGSANG